MLRFKKPAFKKTLARLERLEKLDPRALLEDTGRRGVLALANATPVDTGETANSWSYTIEGSWPSYKISWSNSVMAGGVPLVVLLQYGHATKSGYFLSGRDFINPALDTVHAYFYDRLRQEVFK